MQPVTALILVVTLGERDAMIRAVLGVSGAELKPRVHGDHTVFELGIVNGTNVLLAQSGEQGGVGPAAMMLTASSLLRSIRPDYLILAGICYGLWEEAQQMGDILVARNVQELDHQRIVDGPDGMTIVIRRGAKVHSSVTLLDRFTAATVGRANAPAVHFGLMLSANTLVDSKRYRDNCKVEFPDAMGGDMEGAAIYAAAAKDRVDWIVVKAICDWGYDKTYDYQDMAAANAAEFIVHTLATSRLPRRVPVTEVSTCD